MLFIECPSLMYSLCVLVCSIPTRIACADIKSTSYQSDSSEPNLRRWADPTDDAGRPRSDIACIGTCKGTGLSAVLHRNAHWYVMVYVFAECFGHLEIIHSKWTVLRIIHCSTFELFRLPPCSVSLPICSFHPS